MKLCSFIFLSFILIAETRVHDSRDLSNVGPETTGKVVSVSGKKTKKCGKGSIKGKGKGNKKGKKEGESSKKGKGKGKGKNPSSNDSNLRRTLYFSDDTKHPEAPDEEQNSYDCEHGDDILFVSNDCDEILEAGGDPSLCIDAHYTTITSAPSSSGMVKGDLHRRMELILEQAESLKVGDSVETTKISLRRRHLKSKPFVY